MRIAIAQLELTVGAIESNVAAILKAYDRASALDARVVLTPELGVCGYPPHDLVERPEFFDRCEAALQVLVEHTRGKKAALVVGHVAKNSSDIGRLALNQVSVLEKGRVVFQQTKALLPTYDVFDESRYFEPGHQHLPWECDGYRIGIAICEDLWAESSEFDRKLYKYDPVAEFERHEVDAVFSISASPYDRDKNQNRESLHAKIASRLHVPLLYVNQVGATDEILFDGGSFVCDPENGNLLGRLPLFLPTLAMVDLWPKDSDRPKWINVEGEPSREDLLPDSVRLLCRALVYGIQKYFSVTGFKQAVLGLSGGIDSAVVASLAVQAIGAKNVLGIAMPGPHSSGHSLEDAEILARNLKIKFEVRPIKFGYSVFSKEWGESRGGLDAVALENLQARLRGLILMTYANHDGALALTTGNKSELAMGYCTLYGDMAGALAPIGDLLKTEVYEVAHAINAIWGPCIPERTISKPPSAELRPNQKDEDSLPPYPALDSLIQDYLKNKKNADQLIKEYGPWVRDILNRLEQNEFKRKQAAPSLRVSPKAFGLGRRMPIAKHWKY